MYELQFYMELMKRALKTRSHCHDSATIKHECYCRGDSLLIADTCGGVLISLEESA